MRWKRSCLSLGFLFVLSALTRGVLAGESEKGMFWKFEKGVSPFCTKVKIDHKEIYKREKTTAVVEFQVAMALKEVTPDGEGVWDVKIDWMQVSLRQPSGFHFYDSRRKHASVPAPLEPFAGFVGKKTKLRVSKRGKILKVEGHLKRTPSVGDVTCGGELDPMLARGLVSEGLVRLFDLPRKAGSGKGAENARSYCYGVAGSFPGGTPFSFSLGEETHVRKSVTSTFKDHACENLEWSSTIQSNENTVSMGGMTLKTPAGKVGTGKGKGKFALKPGIVFMRNEAKRYFLPGVSGDFRIDRTVKVEFAGFTRIEETPDVKEDDGEDQDREEGTEGK